jgi:hypothetical protein
MLEDSGDSTKPLMPFTPVQFYALTVSGHVAQLGAEQAEAESMVQGTQSYATTSLPAHNASGFAVGFGATRPQPQARSSIAAVVDVVDPLRTLPARALWILGGGFGARPGHVRLGSENAPVIHWDPGAIEVFTPNLAPGTYPLHIILRNGQAVPFFAPLTIKSA